MSSANSLTREDVLAFLTEREANRPCPACGHGVWEINLEEDWFTLGIPQHATHMMMTPDGPEPRQLSMLVVYVECANCANVRLHLRGEILRWKRRRGGPTNE